MYKFIVIIVLSLMLFLSACKEKNEEVQTESKDVPETIQIKDSFFSKYQLKDDGLYVYADGPDRKRYFDKYSFEYIQKNYKYIRLESKKDKIETGNLVTKRMKCKEERTGVSKLGKPSVYELGYERHEEREIKPEDNRFGREREKVNRWYVYVTRVREDINYKYINKKEFVQLTTSEFIKNGIVILGNSISRVVIKKLSPLPKWGNKILVYYNKSRYNCAGDVVSQLTIKPEIIADFKRINFKENIFEFLKEEPLPEDATYLTDEQFQKLTERVYQFVPRNRYDRTIHKKHSFRPGYYLIEYYDADTLRSYYCIKLGARGKRPPLAEPLNPIEPVIDRTFNKFLVKIGCFDTLEAAKKFAEKFEDFGFKIYKVKNADYVVGKMFKEEIKAKQEKQKLLAKGVIDVKIVRAK